MARADRELCLIYIIKWGLGSKAAHDERGHRATHKDAVQMLEQSKSTIPTFGTVH